nr:hypothetical protein [Tanacetum cinerariifolium]
MPPTMTTQSVGRPAAASRGGGTGGRAGRGGGRTRGRSGDHGDDKMDGQAVQVGDQGRGQGNDMNQNGDAVNDNIWGDVSRGCTYKVFLACNPKEYDGKRGVIVYTCWIEKIESIQDMSGCRDSQKVKYTVGSFIGKALTWWNFQIDTRSREAVVGMSWEDFKTLTRGILPELVPHLVTPKGNRIERYVYGRAPQIQGMVAATEPKTIQKAVQIAGTLTDEALWNGSIKKNPKKRGNEGEPRKDKNMRDDNKRTRIGNIFATVANPVMEGYTGKDYPKNHKKSVKIGQYRTQDWKSTSKAESTGIDNTKTRRLQPRRNTKNDRVPSASKSSCIKNKDVEVEEHHRNLLLYKNKKHVSSECVGHKVYQVKLI